MENYNENIERQGTQENEEVQQVSKFPLWRIFYKNFWFMLIITILVGALGAGYGILRSETVYKAECNVLLSVSISKNTEEQKANYDISLAKLYLPTLTEVMKSTVVLNRANDMYQKEYPTRGRDIALGAVAINYNEDALIFSISYTDADKQLCQDKLEVFIEACSAELNENGEEFFHAQKFLLTPTKNNFIVTESNNLVNYIVIGIGAGLVFSVIMVFLIYLLDNKVKTSAELEELTETSVLAYINKDEA